MEIAASIWVATVTSLTTSRRIVSLTTVETLLQDMAGLLKPQASKILISELREKYPNMPIHVHTHDTSGAGIDAVHTSILA